MTKRTLELSKKHHEELKKLVKKHAKSEDTKLLQKFLLLQLEKFAQEDLVERSIEDLFAVAHTQFKLLKKRKNKQYTLKVSSNKSDDNLQAQRTYVHVVMRDMPFIIDTVGTAITRAGLPIQLTISNRFIIERDRTGNIKKIKANKLNKSKAEKAHTEASIIMEFGPEFDSQALKNLAEKVNTSLKDLTLAVEDWQPMRDKMRDIIQQFKINPPPTKKENSKETTAFLEWLLDDHFTYLGYREYVVENKQGKLSLKNKKQTGLGILRDRGDRRATSSSIHSDDLKKQIENGSSLVLTKANSMSNVHRDSHLDYIGIKQYNKAGDVIGERRFLGLFTSVAYNRSPRFIPVLRQKVQRVMNRSGLDANSHAGKALEHILESYPRDELFQSSAAQLLESTTGLLQIQERKRVKIFMRRDDYRRFFAFTVYVPRDYYNTQVRNSIESILKIAVKGHKVESKVEISDSLLARVYLVVWTKEGHSVSFPRKEYEKILRRAVRPWNDSVERQLEKRLPRAATQRLMQRYKHAFPNAYIEDVSYYEASHDVERLAQLTDSEDEIALSLYRPAGFPDSAMRFKVFHYEQSIPISELVPLLENLGFKTINERPYSLRLSDDSIVWIQDLELVHAQGESLDPAKLREPFQNAFSALYHGLCENDQLNRLVTAARLKWRDIVVLRAYTRYLRQSNLPYSMQYLMDTLLSYPQYAKELHNLFTAQFRLDLSADKRSTLVKKAEANIKKVLNKVTSLDKDRILRAYYSVIKATLRTNFYQTTQTGENKSYLSFKLNPALINELPLPKPKYEIWVYSPEIEGVHLRGGDVARGGLRWSDRPEDFRTEVLGLVKAQMVKNSVIVPVGAKGGFIVRNPDRTSRETWFEQGRTCYQTFLRGLLDVSDNLVNGKVKPAKDVVAKDSYDPYLVVAADKGTATFSDTANSVAAEYDFWLGDAFASGGSVGYDHKGMGITAKGAWESVKRHFLEIGKDIQKEDFTVVGIGDMAGDVFGNGMLLSKYIRLKAAFNHLHIFIDPNPDSATSFAERQRLFNLPRSSWEDYNRKLISTGGGIYSRQAKEIELSAQACQTFNLDKNKFTPNELINLLLKAKVELLWNGGIGTYIKSQSESHVQVGDRANDSLRVNGSELGASVFGEGGNLGATQKGRIEFAQAGGRLNTDFIDNSAGVDCSDHEVNIKILLNLVTQKKKLSLKKRNLLLARMTDEVSELVLRNNYLQSQAISILETRTDSRTDEYMHVIEHLESIGRLNRDIEFLPSREVMLERIEKNQYLTRPEIATIVSYSKMVLADNLLAGKLVDNPYLNTDLITYFPLPLQKEYAKLMPEHRLSREIISTELANEIVNRMGPAFLIRLVEESGKTTDIVAKAYLIARDIFDMRSVWQRISQLDGKIASQEQYRMYIQSSNLIKHAARWFMTKINSRTSITETVNLYSNGVKEIYTHLPRNLGKQYQKKYKALRDHYVALGVSDRNAKRIASTRFMNSTLDIVNIADKAKVEVAKTSLTYSKLGQTLHLNWLHHEIFALNANDQWQAMARNSLRDQAYHVQRELTQKVISNKRSSGDVNIWLATREEKVKYFTNIVKSIQNLPKRDFSTLSVLVEELRQIL